ncbi:MAG: putative capsid protein [Cressdnaviricota sp.]|nr:MAG: putative capsid protein [Cressdnaviricota sp.]
MSLYARKGNSKSTGARGGSVTARVGNLTKSSIARLVKGGKKLGGVKKYSTKTAKSTAQRARQREIKYDDDYYNLKRWQQTGNSASGGGLQIGFQNWVLGGVVTTGVGGSGQAQLLQGSNSVVGVIPVDVMVPNCLTNISSGTTAKSRIGNMVTGRYITLRGVLTAAMTIASEDPETTFKEGIVIGPPVQPIMRFMRTSIRVLLVRDKNMNEKGYVSYNDMFETPDDVNGTGSIAANNPFLWPRKVDTMNRYQVIEEWEYDLDQDDPQCSFTHVVNLGGNPIRFNGAAGANYIQQSSEWLSGAGVPIPNTQVNIKPQGSVDAQSMTNGVYILAVAHSSIPNGWGAINPPFEGPSIVFSTRLTFEDN